MSVKEEKCIPRSQFTHWICEQVLVNLIVNAVQCWPIRIKLNVAIVIKQGLTWLII